jgi:hypothetical protein
MSKSTTGTKTGTKTGAGASISNNSCDMDNNFQVSYEQSNVQNLFSTISLSPSAAPLLSSLPNWTSLSTPSGTSPSQSLPFCVAKKCANGTNSINVQKLLNSSSPVYACISMTKTTQDASGNKLHSCNDGLMLSELPMSNNLPASLNALKNDICVSLPNMSLMKG